MDGRILLACPCNSGRESGILTLLQADEEMGAYTTAWGNNITEPSDPKDPNQAIAFQQASFEGERISPYLDELRIP